MPITQDVQNNKGEIMDSNTILMSVQDKLPKNLGDRQLLRDRLDSLNEQQRNEFMAKIPLLKLKSPQFVFWVGSFLFGGFGVGRFMIGDKILGIARLALYILMLVLYVLGLSLESLTLLGIVNVLNLVIFGWWVADLFLVGKKLRKQNLDKLLSAI